MIEVGDTCLEVPRLSVSFLSLTDLWQTSIAGWFVSLGWVGLVGFEMVEWLDDWEMREEWRRKKNDMAQGEVKAGRVMDEAWEGITERERE